MVGDLFECSPEGQRMYSSYCILQDWLATDCFCVFRSYTMLKVKGSLTVCEGFLMFNDCIVIPKSPGQETIHKIY